MQTILAQGTQRMRGGRGYTERAKRATILFTDAGKDRALTRVKTFLRPPRNHRVLCVKNFHRKLITIHNKHWENHHA